jgi:hypothetical protein
MHALLMKLYGLFRRRPERPAPTNTQHADLPAPIFADGEDGLPQDELPRKRDGRSYRLFIGLGMMAASNPP